jgi:hypothetical protein
MISRSARGNRQTSTLLSCPGLNFLDRPLKDQYTIEKIANNSDEGKNREVPVPQRVGVRWNPMAYFIREIVLELLS